MKKFLSLFLIFSLAVTLVSCQVKPPEGSTGSTDTEGDPSPAPAVTFSHEVAIYHDTVFYCDRNEGGKIKFQNLSDVQDTGTPLFPSNNKSLFFGVNSGTQFIVDPIATVTNGGHPIIYIYLKKDYGLSGTLVAFNTKNNEARILKKDIPNVEQFLLYGEYLIFSFSEGASGRTIHSVKTDGTELCTLENRYKYIMFPQNVLNGEIYFTKGRNLYKAPLSLDSSSLVLEKCNTPVFFCGDHLYYSNCGTYPDSIESDRHLFRVKLDDTSKKETVIDKQVYGIAKDSLFLNYELNSNAIYLYDATTNENKLVYQKKGNKSVACFTETYICLLEKNSGKNFILYYDIATKEEIEIPY